MSAASRRRKFSRPLGERRYRKLFVVAVEGAKTEPQYFGILNNEHSTVLVRCLKGNHKSSPPEVLKRMKEYIGREGLRAGDEAWLVVDKDQWSDEQLIQLHAWSVGHANYGFALSNPNFEYWLLLHFEDGAGVRSSRECSKRLRRYLPEYNKGVNEREIAKDRINDAIRRAKLRDNPPRADWPRSFGGTTVYRLVEHIIQAADDR